MRRAALGLTRNLESGSTASGPVSVAGTRMTRWPDGWRGSALLESGSPHSMTALETAHAVRHSSEPSTTRQCSQSPSALSKAMAAAQGATSRCRNTSTTATTGRVERLTGRSVQVHIRTLSIHNGTRCHPLHAFVTSYFPLSLSSLAANRSPAGDQPRRARHCAMCS